MQLEIESNRTTSFPPCVTIFKKYSQKHLQQEKLKHMLLQLSFNFDCKLNLMDLHFDVEG